MFEPGPRWLLACFGLAAILLGACSQKAPEPQDRLGPTFHKYRMDGSLFSGDEKLVLFTAPLGDVPNVFTYDLEADKTTPVTQSKRASYAVSFVPGTAQVIYRSTVEGQNVEHPFLREASGQDLDLLRGSPNAQAVFYAWTGDKKEFYYGSNRDDRRFMYVYRLPMDTKSGSQVLQTQDMRFAAASATGRNLALWSYMSVDKSAVYMYDSETKVLDKVAPEKTDAVATPQFFEAGSDNVLYYLTNENSPVLSLYRYDVQSKAHSQVYLANESILFARQSANKRYFVIGVPRGEQLGSRLFDTQGGTWNEVSLPEPGLILDISASGKLLLYTTGAENDAKSLRVYNLQTKDVRNVRPF